MPTLKKLINLSLLNPTVALWQGFHQLRRKSRIEYNLKTGWSLCPDFITIIPTEKCNYLCAHCSAHSPEINKNRLIKAEFTGDDFRKIIDEVSFYKPIIYFCGGEPTIRPDIVKLISYVKKKKLICAMTTNASLLGESLAKKLVYIGIDFISLSVDGDEKTHDKSRGIKGAYNKVVRTVKLLKQFKKNKVRPHIKLVGIIDPENPLRSLHVLKLGNRLGVDEIAFGHFMFYPEYVKKGQEKFIKKYNIGSSYITGMELKGKFNVKIDELKLIINVIKNNKPVHTSIVPNSDLDVEKYYEYPYQYPSLKSECLTPWFSAIIKPNGDVSPCMDFKVGNIKNMKFLDMWNTPKWRLLRKIKSSRKINIPACFRCGCGQNILF